MTNLEKSSYDDVRRYEYAALASHLAQSKEGQEIIPGALEKLLHSLNEDAALSTSVAIKHGGEKDIIDLYTGKYQKALNSITIEEYLKEEGINCETAKEKFGKFFNETYETIDGKIEEAKDILKIGGYKFPDKEKERARGNIKEYGGIYLLINSIQNRKFEKLRAEVAGENYNKAPDEIMKDPDKYVNKIFAEYLNMNHEKAEEESYK